VQAVSVVKQRDGCQTKIQAVYAYLDCKGATCKFEERGRKGGITTAHNDNNNNNNKKNNNNNNKTRW
jgi:hypothetical protein